MTQQFVENLMEKLSNEIVENCAKRTFLSDLIFEPRSHTRLIPLPDQCQGVGTAFLSAFWLGAIGSGMLFAR